MSLLRKISTIDRSYANFKRYMEIIDLLVKFGFGDLASALNFDRVRVWSCSLFHKKTGMCAITQLQPRTVRVRLLLEALGPTFVKLGQVLSSRPDLIPIEYSRELSRLQDHVPGFPGETARDIVCRELGRPVEQIFKEFTLEPFAAASIGQVHRAVLKDGRPVVVKVQRPGIERKIAIDLEIMYNLAVRLEKSDLDLASFRPSAIVEEFSHVLTREINYMVEATHARRFAADMKNQPGIYVPHVYMDYSSNRVLTLELIDGVSGRKVLADPAMRTRFDLPLIARYGADALMAQIFKYGFFHADPHPGNLFLLPENRLCFIDFGMMGRVTEEERGHFIQAVRAILSEDFGKLTHAVRKLATETGPTPDWALLERDLGDLVQENLYLPIEKLSLAHILEQLMKTMSFHKLALRPDLFVMFKALMTIENVAREFDPKLRILDILESAMRQSRFQRFEVMKKLETAKEGLNEWWELGNEFPPAARKLIQKAAEGSLVIKLEHHRLLPLENTIRYAIGMLAGAVIFASLMISSALIVHAGIPPRWHGVPLLGVIGFVLSAIMAIYLILRKRPNKKRY